MRSLCFALLVAVPVLAQTPPQPGQASNLTARQKAKERLVRSIWMRGLIGGAVAAAIGQGLNTPSEWGQGAEGFSKRYASAFTGTVTRESMQFGIEALDHEDPRYFPCEESSAKARLLNALKQTVWSKRDDGSEGFAYGRVVSAFANGQLTNAWQPDSNNSVGIGIKRAFITLGADTGLNLAQEFVPFLRHKPSHRHE